MRPSVILADDHVMVGQALASYLRERYELLAVVTNGEDLLAAHRRRPPDVIILDISMPTVSGLECLRRLRREGSKVKVIILTMHRSAELASEALRAGANAYLLKHSSGDELTAAMQDVLAGHTYISKEIADEVMTELTSPFSHTNRALTARQKDIMRLVATGQTVKQIAAHLGLSPRTVESYKYEIMDILGVGTTAELIQYAVKSDITEN